MNTSTSFPVALLLLALSLSLPAFADTKAPSGVDPTQTSTDAGYGLSKENPVKVGDKDSNKGPSAERAYLDTLRNDDGKPVRYSRIGNFGAGPDGHIIDGYDVETSTGKKFVIYIDMYHPENDPVKQPAPAGLWKAK